MMKINSALRLASTDEDGMVREADSFDNWLRTLHFSNDRPDEYAKYAILEATPHEVTLCLQNEGWEFRGKPENPPYRFSKGKFEIELEPADSNRTKITSLEDRN